MEENLFEKAKEMMINFTSKKEEQQPEDEEIVKQAIQAAYSVASPEEKEHLEQFERQLNNLH